MKNEIKTDTIAHTGLSACRTVVQHAIGVAFKRHKLSDSIEVDCSKGG